MIKARGSPFAKIKTLKFDSVTIKINHSSHSTETAIFNKNQLVNWIINRCKLKSERKEARHNNKSLSKSSVSWQNQQPGRGNELKIDSRSATTERLNNYRHIRINMSVTSRWQDTLLCATNLLRKRFAGTARKSAAQKKCPQNLGMKKIVCVCPPMQRPLRALSCIARGSNCVTWVGQRLLIIIFDQGQIELISWLRWKGGSNR